MCERERERDESNDVTIVRPSAQSNALRNVLGMTTCVPPNE